MGVLEPFLNILVHAQPFDQRLRHFLPALGEAVSVTVGQAAKGAVLVVIEKSFP